MVRRLFLEAPAADLREIVQLRSGGALPVEGILGDSFLAAGRILVTLRTGVGFDHVDHTARATSLDIPILLLLGTDDGTVRHAISDELTAARPDLVEFHSILDADHVRAWNEDPAWYAETVAVFLARTGSIG